MAGVLLNHTHSTSPWYDVRVRLWDTIKKFQENAPTFGIISDFRGVLTVTPI